MRRSVVSLELVAVMVGALAACNDSTATTGISPPPDSTAEIVLTPVATGLSLPLYLTAPAGGGRLFVVEKTGRIRIVKDGALLPTPRQADW